MKIDEAVEIIAKHVRKTRRATANAVEHLWPNHLHELYAPLKPSEVPANLKLLCMRALRDLANDELLTWSPSDQGEGCTHFDLEVRGGEGRQAGPAAFEIYLDVADSDQRVPAFEATIEVWEEYIAHNNSVVEGIRIRTRAAIACLDILKREKVATLSKASRRAQEEAASVLREAFTR